MLISPLSFVIKCGEDLLLNGVSILGYIKAVIKAYDE